MAAIMDPNSISAVSKSVASERVFSKCGRVCSDRRASLKHQHVEHLVFLSHNLAGD